MGAGLRILNSLASSSTIDKLKLRKPTEKAIFHSTKNGFKVAAAAGRQFSAKSKQDKPARQPRVFIRRPPGYRASATRALRRRT